MSNFVEDDWSNDTFYDHILAVYEEVIAEGRDLVNAGSYLVVQLARIMKEGPALLPNTVENCLILIISLFFQRDEQILQQEIDLSQVNLIEPMLDGVNLEYIRFLCQNDI